MAFLWSCASRQQQQVDQHHQHPDTDITKPELRPDYNPSRVKPYRDMSGNMAGVQAEFLTCKICKQPYIHPKVLSCLHTFCKNCLVHHVRDNGVKGKDGAVGIFCPTCTQVCDLPRGGVDGLKDNQLLRNLLEMVNSRSLQTCDMCREEGENHAATYCCIKCEEFLCDECAQMHKRTRITSDHMVVNVGSMMDVCRGLKGYDNGSMINSRLLSKFGRHGNALFYPISICVNMADDILISNDNNTISIFTLSGSCKKVLNQQAFYGSEKNVLPNRGITVTSEGYVAVALRKDITPQVAHMGVTQSLAGREISLLSAKIKNPRDCQPHGIAITPDNYTVISDIGRNCVYVFDPELQMVRCFGKRGSKGRRQFKTPYFVAVTPTGDILVSDYGNHCVKVFDLKGKPRFVIGRMGKRPGEFVHPMGICTDRYGNIFVADRDNHRVQMFSGNGRFLGFIIERTCKDGQDIRPQDVAITTHGHLVVLLRGIEGIDMAEVHLYQYGSSHPSSSSSALSARDVVSQRDVKPDVPRRLQPISPDGREPSLTPDLLTPATKVKDRHMAEELLAMYQAGKPMNKDQDSQICTIL